jgi:hypothetical protein
MKYEDPWKRSEDTLDAENTMTRPKVSSSPAEPSTR